jgi:ABC-type branched-subunit amino acid transport system substrate-binding protein
VRGVTASTISIGVFYASDGKEAVGAAGGTGDRGNEKGAYEAIFADINARGGIAGHKIVPVWYKLDFGDQRPRDAQEQPACEHFTQDHAVFAVLTTKAGGATDGFKACLEKAGVVHVAGNFTVAGDSTYRQFPHYVEPDGLSIERGAAAMPPSLAERKWLSGWNTVTGQPGAGKAAIGIVTLDYPTFKHAVDDVLVPGFKALGVEVKGVARMSTTDNAAVASGVSSAVLSFRREGVTHVVIMQSAGTAQLLFVQQADSQNYFPRYAFTSQEIFPLLLEAKLLSSATASRSFNGAMGVGWWPSADTSYGRSVYSKTPAARACASLLRRHQQAPVSALQETLAYFHCDVVNTLKQAVEAGGPTISPDSFLRGLDLLPTPFGAAGTLRSVLRMGKRDGVSVVRGFAWEPSCTCFVHSGAERAVR